jgi:2'-5' RNA ligase
MDSYQALVARLIREVPGVLRSIPQRTHHLTLAFLGEIAESDVDMCSASLDSLKRVETFGYSLAPPTILMGRGRPRLIRVSVTDGMDLVRNVQTTLISRVSEQLPSLDSRSKPPHITLARFKKTAKRSQARQVETAIERNETPLQVQDHFSRVQLVKSDLTPSGPIYETLCEVHLAEAS